MPTCLCHGWLNACDPGWYLRWLADRFRAAIYIMIGQRKLWRWLTLLDTRARMLDGSPHVEVLLVLQDRETTLNRDETLRHAGFGVTIIPLEPVHLPEGVWVVRA
jgi:hypothetical protein